LMSRQLGKVPLSSIGLLVNSVLNMYFENDVGNDNDQFNEPFSSIDLIQLQKLQQELFSLAKNDSSLRDAMSCIGDLHKILDDESKLSVKVSKLPLIDIYKELESRSKIFFDFPKFICVNHYSQCRKFLRKLRNHLELNLLTFGNSQGRQYQEKLPAVFLEEEQQQQKKQRQIILGEQQQPQKQQQQQQQQLTPNINISGNVEVVMRNFDEDHTEQITASTLSTGSTLTSSVVSSSSVSVVSSSSSSIVAKKYQQQIPKCHNCQENATFECMGGCKGEMKFCCSKKQCKGHTVGKMKQHQLKSLLIINCDNCVDDDIHPAIFYCSQCRQKFCEICFKGIHDNLEKPHDVQDPITSNE